MMASSIVSQYLEVSLFRTISYKAALKAKSTNNLAESKLSPTACPQKLSSRPLSGPGHFTRHYAIILCGTIWTPLPWLAFLTNMTASKTSDKLQVLKSLPAVQTSSVHQLFISSPKMSIYVYIKKTGDMPHSNVRQQLSRYRSSYSSYLPPIQHIKRK